MKYSFRLSNSQKIVLPEKFYSAVQEILEDWEVNKIPEKLWKHDQSVWKKKNDPELSNRMGWLLLPSLMQNEISRLKNFADEIKEKFDNVLLLGMGGSSLAPEVFFKTFGNKKGYPSLTILDSTHPDSVNKIIETFNLEKTLFIVASKSGTTTETLSFYYTLYEILSKRKSNPGENFVAVTDPGTSLEKLANEKKFKKIFSTPEEVGGRYSALTFFGLLPAALIGVDIELILKRAEKIKKLSEPGSTLVQNPGFILGAVLGKLSIEGIDKLTIFASPEVSSFPVWIEQLIAESTGKEGKGILPVVDESPGSPDVYGKDRIFVYLRLKDGSNSELDSFLKKLEEKNFPVIYINLNDIYDIGHEFYRWEIATAIAGSVMEINPFDQPNVQLAKSLAKEYMDRYKKEGKLPEENPIIKNKNFTLFGDFNSNNFDNIIKDFLKDSAEGNYAALMAFIPRSDVTDKALEKLRTAIRNKFKIPVTTGYGPRFLHSTGQLHKGDGGKGYFIQFSSKAENDIEVPAAGYSFGTLVSAQAQGDMKALQNNGRKVIRIHFDSNPAEGITDLATSIIKQ